MKRIFTFVCAAVMAISAMHAKLIFHESFDDPNGTIGDLRAGDTNTEDFFDGNNYEQTRWWTLLGSSNYIQVAEGSMAYPGYQTEGLGNKVYLWSTGADDVRSFASQNVTSGKVYLSAIINVDAVKQKADADYFLSLCDHANGYFLGRLHAKSVQEDGVWKGFKLGISKNNESVNYLHYTSEVFAPQTDILVVIEYEFVSGEKNDVVRLYINPDKDTTQPTLTCVPDTLTGGGVQQGANSKNDAGQYGLFGVLLRQGTNTPKVYVDEIKVGTAWEDIWVEKTSGDEPEEAAVDNIAALKDAEAYKTVLLKSQPVVVHNFSGDVAVQDESGAVILNDFFDTNLLSNVKVGDKLSNLSVAYIDSKDFINGLPTARLSYATTPEIVSHDNSVEPFEVSLADAAAYGAAWVLVSDVQFATNLVQFAEGLVEIKQGQATADLVVPAGCDIIGELIPQSACIQGLVTQNNSNGLRIRISASADINSRVMPGEETGVEDAALQGQSVRKELRNGQMIIVRDGQIFTVTGTEIK